MVEIRKFLAGIIIAFMISIMEMNDSSHYFKQPDAIEYKMDYTPEYGRKKLLKRHFELT